MADNDRVKGKAEQGMGSVKEMAGKATGNERLQAEGSAQKTKGKVQDTAGRAKDKAKEITGKVT
jgi:uncharacterized protein YjbJ (UPF0337 family)